MAKKFLGTVILPGMFDPVTTGHMNSLKYLSERSDKVYAVIMTLKSEEQNRWIPSETMKRLIEAAIAEEKLDNVSVYIESEGWLAHSIETLGADGVARSFHPNINIEKEVELIRSVIELGIPLHLIPSHLELRSSHIRWLSEEQLMDEFKEQVPASVYRYIQENIV
ncbi:MAG: hypothetical protein DBX53_08210 [Clostridiales bacterium]|jgi:pantetheine-phosphate adenylyltransferase|nr:MAG: hypothetical protein DBX53_08210 [Clostridiales bacterium]